MTGWALHGLVFEFVDHTRAGYIIGAQGQVLTPLLESTFRLRGGESAPWEDVDPGDYIVEISGFDLSRFQEFLCHSITLKFASGKTINFQPENNEWRGEPFQFRNTSEYQLPFMPVFRNGRCRGMASLHTSIHRPLTLCSASFYPHREELFHLFKMFNRLDLQHLEKPLGPDMWWLIVGMLHSQDICPYHPPIGNPIPLWNAQTKALHC
jgi:hypothetical protein